MRKGCFPVRENSLDPQLLFQRLLVIAGNRDLSLDELPRYEVSVYPPALFDHQGLLNPENKSHIKSNCKTSFMEGHYSIA